MEKRWIVLGVVLLFFLAVVLSPGPGEESSKEEETTLKPFADQLKEEITTIWADIEKVEYFETTRHVNVWFVKEAVWDESHLRDTFCYATFDIMATLVKHADKIDSVTIIGKTTMIDMQGNKKIEKVFQAKVTMDRAKNVKWENLEDVGTLKPLYANFDDIWWHPAVRP
ncbi:MULTISPECIES: hypothetical protein [unclassified Archaeoglobus]|uniref:hypothetical protein n=1 Tax=unclassified Archaeoglobus TaxID=2643606 RepID=UPI0025BADC04|nr:MULTISPECIES: hypothetical protein [unclassified Archaeoglobus]